MLTLIGPMSSWIRQCFPLCHIQSRAQIDTLHCLMPAFSKIPLLETFTTINLDLNVGIHKNLDSKGLTFYTFKLCSTGILHLLHIYITLYYMNICMAKFEISNINTAVKISSFLSCGSGLMMATHLQPKHVALFFIYIFVCVCVCVCVCNADWNF